MKLHLVLGAFLLGASTMCFALEQPTEAMPDANSLMDRKFEEWMLVTLKDPESAKWQRTSESEYRSFEIEYPEFDRAARKAVMRKRHFSGFFACYRMNSKNSFGGYVGYRTFVAYESFTGDGFLVWSKGMVVDRGFKLVAPQIAEACPN